MGEYTQIIYEVDRGRAHIALNRPEKLNALSETLLTELNDALWQADLDTRVHAVCPGQFGNRGNTMVRGDRQNILAAANLLIEKIDKLGQHAIRPERDVKHLARVRSPAVANQVVRRKADGKQIRFRTLSELFCANGGLGEVQ